MLLGDRTKDEVGGKPVGIEHRLGRVPDEVGRRIGPRRHLPGSQIHVQHDVRVVTQGLHPCGEDERVDLPDGGLHLFPAQDGAEIRPREQADTREDRHRHEEFDGRETPLE